jgi:hypothetical protein
MKSAEVEVAAEIFKKMTDSRRQKPPKKPNSKPATGVIFFCFAVVFLDYFTRINESESSNLNSQIKFKRYSEEIYFLVTIVK